MYSSKAAVVSVDAITTTLYMQPLPPHWIKNVLSRSLKNESSNYVMRTPPEVPYPSPI